MGIDLTIPDEEPVKSNGADQPKQLILHQSRYAYDVLERFVEDPAKERLHPGEPESFTRKRKLEQEPVLPTGEAPSVATNQRCPPVIGDAYAH